jgi:hypothetical protein
MKNRNLIQSAMRRIALIAGLLTVLATSVHAQDLTLSVHVPFAFHAGDLVLPAGHYDFRVIESLGTRNIMRITDVAHKNVAETILTKVNNSQRYGMSPRLSFHRYGEEYFLAAVEWGYRTANEVPSASHERQSTQAVTIRIAARAVK